MPIRQSVGQFSRNVYIVGEEVHIQLSNWAINFFFSYQRIETLHRDLLEGSLNLLLGQNIAITKAINFYS